MTEQIEANRATVIFDPSLIPQNEIDTLARETLLLVQWMMTIPKYREAIEALTMARRTAMDANKEGRYEA